MTERTKIFTVAHVPAELQQAWLQHLRDFDTAHPECHFEVGIEGGPDLSLAEMVERIQVEPKLGFTQIFGKTRWACADCHLQPGEVCDICGRRESQR